MEDELIELYEELDGINGHLLDLLSQDIWSEEMVEEHKELLAKRTQLRSLMNHTRNQIAKTQTKNCMDSMSADADLYNE